MKTVNVFGNSSPIKNRIYFLIVIIGWLSFYQIASAQSTEKNKKVIFSSQYTNLQKCDSGMTKEEEKGLAKSATDEGQDQPLICIGYDNYEIFADSHGCGMQFQIRVRTNEEIKDVVIMEELDHTDPIYKRSIEWRMANGKPFAVIFTRNVYAGTDDPCLRKKTGEVTRVIGLTNKNIDFTINSVKTKNAKTEARLMADRTFSAQTAKTNGQKQMTAAK